jgi:hypothetical protein
MADGKPKKYARKYMNKTANDQVQFDQTVWRISRMCTYTCRFRQLLSLEYPRKDEITAKKGWQAAGISLASWHAGKPALTSTLP